MSGDRSGTGLRTSTTTWPRHYGAVTWPRHYGAVTWPRHYGAVTWPRDYGAVTWPRDYGPSGGEVVDRDPHLPEQPGQLFNLAVGQRLEPEGAGNDLLGGA